MTPEKAIDKIRKLQALGSSTNENEAAIAMRQAKYLMEQFNITEYTLQTSEYGVAEVDAQGFNQTFAHECVMRLLSRYFRVKILFAKGIAVGSHRKKRQVMFYGSKKDVLLCAYFYDVLLRLLKSRKAAYLKQYSSSLNKQHRVDKTKIGELYCRGWFNGVIKNLPIEPLTPEEDERLNRFMHESQAETINPARPGKESSIDVTDPHLMKAFYSGNEAGEQVRLHNAVGNDGVGLKAIKN